MLIDHKHILRQPDVTILHLRPRVAGSQMFCIPGQLRGGESKYFTVVQVGFN